MKHHAICYVHELQARRDLARYFEASDPDVHILKYDELGIGDARELTRRSSLTPLSAVEHVFVVTCNGLSHEAQNALLKLFEEPPQKTQFYLIVPKKGLLLPTLQSRLMIVEETAETRENTEDTNYHHFKSASYGERIELVAQITKANDSDHIEALLLGAEREATLLNTEPELKRIVLMVRDSMSRRGASKKMLLELLALHLPKK